MLVKTKKKIIVWTVVATLVTLLIVSTIAVVKIVKWVPYRLENPVSVTVGDGTTEATYYKGDERFDEYITAVEKTLYSARFSITLKDSKLHWKPDEYSLSLIKENEYWIEIIQETSTYKKLLLNHEKGETKGVIQLIASKNGGYNTGEYVIYHYVDCDYYF